MLLKHWVQNHGMFHKVTISMVACDQIQDRHATWKEDQITWRGIFSDDVLPVVAVYGEDSSGKSVVVDSLDLMKRIVQNGSYWYHEGLTQDIVQQAVQQADGPVEISFFVELLIRGSVYHYGFTLEKSVSCGSYPVVSEEWLYLSSREDRLNEQKVFVRKGAEVTKYTLNGGDTSTEKMKRNNDLFLSIKKQPEGHPIKAVSDWFENLLVSENIDIYSDEEMDYEMDLKIADSFQDPWYRQRVLESTDIVDIRSPNKDHKFHYEYTTYEYTYRDAIFKRKYLSKQDRHYLYLLSKVTDVLKHGKVLIVEDIDVIYVSRLKAYIVELFSTAECNPHGAQLIFGTHDTVFMRGNPRLPLSKLKFDQIYIVGQPPGQPNTSQVYPLSRFGTGDGVDVATEYLMGLYGGISYRISSPRKIQDGVVDP